MKKRRLLFLCALIGVGALSFYFLFSSRQKPTIVLDAGHDQSYPGYQGFVQEADYTREFVSLLEEKLKETKQYKVVLTHALEEDANLEERQQVIEKHHPDLVISIHTQFSRENESGFSVFSLPPGKEQHEESLLFLNYLQEEYQEERNAFYGYLYYAPLPDGTYQLHKVPLEDTQDYQEETIELMGLDTYPMVEIDPIYVTSQEDVEQYTSPEGMKEDVEKIVQAIANYFSAKDMHE